MTTTKRHIAALSDLRRAAAEACAFEQSALDPQDWSDAVDAAIAALCATLPATPPLDTRELATVLAALRAWQNVQQHEPPAPEVMDIATCGGTLTPLADGEVDALCERLNTNHHDALAGALAALLDELEMADCTDALPRELTDRRHPLTIRRCHAGAVLAALAAGAAAPPPTPVLTLAVIVEGGNVQAILSNRPADIARAVVIDYDTDGADRSELVDVPQPGGSTAPALVTAYPVEQSENAAIDFAEVIRRADAHLTSKQEA